MAREGLEAPHLVAPPRSLQHHGGAVAVHGVGRLASVCGGSRCLGELLDLTDVHLGTPILLVRVPTRNGLVGMYILPYFIYFVK